MDERREKTRDADCQDQGSDTMVHTRKTQLVLLNKPT